jgi:hypothetical protein
MEQLGSYIIGAVLRSLALSLKRQLDNPWLKPGSCPLRKTEPQGPMKICQDVCDNYDDCLIESKNFKPRKKRIISDPTLIVCDLCQAQGVERIFSNQGMFNWHLKKMHNQTS